ncbi:MAG: helix-turn-helix transcriptional regulator [Ruminococcus callidus]
MRCSCASNQQNGYPLQLFGCIYRICHALWNLTQNNTEPWEPNDSKRLEAMHKMVGFIQQKYGSKIALQDIAAAGYVCRSSCCSIFKEYLNQTPNAYLTEYRISKSIELLSNPDLSVTEIAMQCGFSGSSYFTETFRKAIGCTPSDYRMRKQQRR